MTEKWLRTTIVHPEMKMFHSRCRWGCFFIWEIQHYITCSVTDALQWMGAVRMRVQTADKNITIIHSSPSVNILSCEVKSCVFVRNHWDILTVNHHCLPKYKSIIHNKVYSLSHQNPLTYLLRTFWTVFRAWSVHISLLIQHDFSLKKAILCIEERWSEIKTVLNRDLFISNMQLFTSQYINWWTGVVWIIVMF